MPRLALILGWSFMLAGCCTAMRERVDVYARTAAENADTARILVERCRHGDGAACDGAVRTLERQRVAAETLGGSPGGAP